MELRIQELRKARGWSQGELARRLGVPRQTIARWETEGPPESIQLLFEIAQLFGVTVDELRRSS